MFVCNQPGACFAKRQSIKNPENVVCDCLTSPYEGSCPFQKPYRFVTDGIFYPFNPKKNPDLIPYEYIEEEDYEEVVTLDYFNNPRNFPKRKRQED